VERRVNLIARLDFTTIVLYLALVLLGWLNIYAAVYNDEHQSIFDFTQRYGKQMIWIVAAVFIAITIIFVDSKAFSAFAYIIYGVAIVALIFVMGFAREIQGARSWFEIGGFRIQPAEFAKFATALALSKFLSGYNVHLSNNRTFAYALAIIFIPALLVVLQNDTGSALVFLAFMLVMYREGMHGIWLFLGFWFVALFVVSLLVQLWAVMLVISLLSIGLFAIYSRKWNWIAGSVAIALIFWGIIQLVLVYFYQINKPLLALVLAFFLSGVVYLYWIYRFKIAYAMLILIFQMSSIVFVYAVDYAFFNILEQHQQTRINVLLGIEEDAMGAGYNIRQSLIAIGSGGVYGKGFLQGTQTKYNFVPEQSTDFIFCTVGEEWGFLGSITVLGLFLFLILRIIYLAENQKSAFSRIFGYSVAAIIFFHLTINIGMTIGLAPVIGIPLPFFSYGGSSLWAFTILLFIFIRLDASRWELL